MSLIPRRVQLQIVLLLVMTLPVSVTAMTEAEKAEKIALIKQLKQRGEVVFAIVPKTTQVPFFQASGEGCEEAAKKLGVHCVFFGSSKENGYEQLEDILSLIDAGVDGLAISEYVEGWIKKRLTTELEQWGKPVISFDSPIYASFSKSYIGTDNYQLGLKLGKEVHKLRPQGGVFCIHSEREDSPNHSLRIKGIMDGLIQSDNDRKIWKQGRGCPMYHHAILPSGLVQMKRLLQWNNVDTYITTGGGPQYMLEPYVEAMTPYKNAISSGELVVASIDTTPNQLKHHKAGLSSINIGQRPYLMGELSVQTLLKLHQGQPVAEVIHTGMIECYRASPCVVDK